MIGRAEVLSDAPPSGWVRAPDTVTRVSGRPANPPVRRLLIVFDFYCFEMLTALRLRVQLRLFQTLLVVACLTGLLLLLTVAVLGFALLRALTAEQPGAVNGLTVILCAGNVYVCGAYLVREAFSGRRFTVANSPNLRFFRALDIRARDVLIVYCGLRGTVFHLAVLLVDGAYLVVVGSSARLSASEVAAVLAVPVAMYVGMLSVAARAASRRVRPTPLRWPVVLASGASCLAFGYATGHLLLGPLRAGGLAASFSDARAGLLVTALGAVAAGAGVVATARLVVHARRIARHSFAIQETEWSAQETESAVQKNVRADPGPGRVGDRLAGALLVPATLHRELAGSAIQALLRRTFAAVLLSVLGGLGIILSGAGVLPLDAGSGPPSEIVDGVVFIVLIGVAEPVLRAVGPTRFAAHLRFAWEQSLSQWRIAAGVTAYCLLPPVALATALTALVAMLTGAITAGPVGIGVAVTSAGLIAESTTAAPRNVDGSLVPNTLGGVLMLILASPVLLALSSASMTGDVLAGVYSLGLLGGAVTCLVRRIRTLPLTSVM